VVLTGGTPVTIESSCGPLTEDRKDREDGCVPPGAPGNPLEADRDVDTFDVADPDDGARTGQRGANQRFEYGDVGAGEKREPRLSDQEEATDPNQPGKARADEARREVIVESPEAGNGLDRQERLGGLAVVARHELSQAMVSLGHPRHGPSSVR